MDPVPIVDLGAFNGESPFERDGLVQTVSAAVEELGGFVVRGHDLSADLYREFRQVTTQFFELPARYKQQWVPEGWEGQAGFSRVDRLQRFSANRFDGPDQAIAAGYPLPVALTLAPNVWPDRPALMEVVWKTYYRAMQSLTQRLDQVLAAVVDHDPEAWVNRFDGHLSALSAQWHPSARPEAGAALGSGRRNPRGARPDGVDPGTAGVDSGGLGSGGLGSGGLGFTLVPFDAAAALSIGSLVQDTPAEISDRHGRWHPVPAVADGFLVTVGPVAQQWSRHHWHAPIIRNSAGESRGWEGRLQVAYVHRPHHDALVS